MRKKTIFGVFLFATFLPVSIVSADVNQTQKMYEETTAECKVYYYSKADFSVSIPKKITLNSNKISSYDVIVAGDISSGMEIIVKPDTSFVMKDVSNPDNPKDDVMATVSQEDTVWNWEEAMANKKKSGNVTASKLSAGNWEGTFNFTITLNDK